MNIKFISPAVFVKDIKVSKEFYTEVLKQEIEFDDPKYVSYKSGFSIWEGDFALNIIQKKENNFKTKSEEKSFELYFETEELDEVYKNLSTREVKFIHEIHQHPWGQRGFRVYDPDEHIIEIAEPMAVVIKRYADQGDSPETISKKTSFPLEMVKEILK